jgi:uncharacterized membrane protein YphA (DoxX/SURF4 family)
MNHRASEPVVVGWQPWLPWPLSRSRWWTEPVPAERLAAVRIGLAGFLLLDILLTYWPQIGDFFGRDSLGSPEVFAFYRSPPHWHWSILGGIEDVRILRAAAGLWAVATFSLMIGFFTRTSAVITWVLSTSFASLNSCIDNAGDEIRGIILFYLMVSPCGAAWSIDRWRRRRAAQSSAPGAPVFIHPWPLRLLMVQMVFIYFSNGVFKLTGKTWGAGDSLYYVLSDLTLARWSYAQVTVPYWITKLLTWFVLGWEAGFPLWVALPWTRKAALWFGVAFHLGIGISMELGFFVPYALCFYLPLVPWERFGQGKET